MQQRRDGGLDPLLDHVCSLPLGLVSCALHAVPTVPARGVAGRLAGVCGIRR
jgi:hypothetical protein